MTERLRSFGVVSLLTILVWLLAEGESLRGESLQIEVRFESGTSALDLSVRDPEFIRTINVRLEGSTSRLEAGITALRKAEPLRLTTVELGDQSGQVRLAEALRRHRLFERSGVSISQVEPPTVDVIVDPIIDREARVQIEAGGALLDATAHPDRVSVRLPERFSRDITELTVVARLRPETIEDLVPGRATSIPGVALELPPALADVTGWTITPTTARVSVTLASRIQKLDLRLSVDIRLPSAIIDQYVMRVDPQDAFQTVEVQGPAELIQQIGQRYQPRLEVFIGPDRLQTALAAAGDDEVELPRTPRLIDAPAGVELADTNRLVKVYVRRRPEPVDDDGAAPTD